MLGMCATDAVFFFNAFLVTYDDRTDIKDLPFITYPFQDDYIKTLEEHIERQEDLLTEKSRDMGATDMVLGVFLKRWLFNGDSFLLGSRLESVIDKQGDVTSLFGRLRHKMKFLPPWMLPQGFNPRNHDSYMKLVNPDQGAAITGQAMTGEFSRGGRYRGVLLDELAFADNAAMAWQATADSTNCRLPISTPSPEGMANFFSRLRFGGKIKVATLHWKQHPRKNEAWYDREKERRRPEELAREVDINYEGSASAYRVIQPDWVRKAQQNAYNLGPDVIVVTCDIARYGDDETVIYVLHGFKIIHKIVLDHNSTMEAAGLLKRLREDFKARAIAIEVVGIGAGVVDRLTELGEPVMPINPGEQASDPTKFSNFRAEMWWGAGQLFREGLVSVDQDDELMRQLVAPAYKVMDSYGKIQIESKDEIKKPERLGRSTDHADALIIGLWAVRAISAYELTQNLTGKHQIITGEQMGVSERIEIGPGVNYA